jgi:hypothetical protein
LGAIRAFPWRCEPVPICAQGTSPPNRYFSDGELEFDSGSEPVILPSRFCGSIFVLDRAWARPICITG